MSPSAFPGKTSIDSKSAPFSSAHSMISPSPPKGTFTCASQFWLAPVTRLSIESIIIDMVPKMSIDRPTAKKVNTSLIGFLTLDLTVRPTVVGRRDVSL